MNWITGLVVVGGIGVLVHGMSTQRGPVGWIIYAQQAVFGAASMKVTFLIACTAVILLGLAIVAAANLLFTSDHPQIAVLQPEQTPGGMPARHLLLVALGGVALTWAITAEGRRRGDLRAGAPRTRGGHAAIAGVAHCAGR
jgi:hypothetical protein